MLVFDIQIRRRKNKAGPDVNTERHFCYVEALRNVVLYLSERRELTPMPKPTSSKVNSLGRGHASGGGTSMEGNCEWVCPGTHCAKQIR